MDVAIINSFIASVTDVMPQLGFGSIIIKNQLEKSKKIVASGIVLTLGIVGDKKGNVAYAIDTEGVTHPELRDPRVLLDELEALG